jgi:hypothetical protein
MSEERQLRNALGDFVNNVKLSQPGNITQLIRRFLAFHLTELDSEIVYLHVGLDYDRCKLALDNAPIPSLDPALVLYCLQQADKIGISSNIGPAMDAFLSQAIYPGETRNKGPDMAALISKERQFRNAAYFLGLEFRADPGFPAYVDRVSGGRSAQSSAILERIRKYDMAGKEVNLSSEIGQLLASISFSDNFLSDLLIWKPVEAVPSVAAETPETRRTDLLISLDQSESVAAGLDALSTEMTPFRKRCQMGMMTHPTVVAKQLICAAMGMHTNEALAEPLMLTSQSTIAPLLGKDERQLAATAAQSRELQGVLDIPEVLQSDRAHAIANATHQWTWTRGELVAAMVAPEIYLSDLAYAKFQRYLGKDNGAALLVENLANL